MSRVHQLTDSPVLIVGMHRSGTSLIARLLKGLGMFTGDVLEENDESPLFIALNQQILSIAHAHWDSPEPIENLYTDDALVAKVADIVGAMLATPDNLRIYLGQKGMQDSLGPSVWGWKDPRTTVTWPVWKKLFPKMRLLFVCRNGVDVAESLRKRSQADTQAFLTMPHATAIQRSQFLSLRCLDLRRAFSLWETYNEIFLNLVEKYGPVNFCQIKFEDFIASPQQTLQSISAFAGLRVSSEAVASLCGSIKPMRRNAYLHSEELRAFHDNSAARPMMVRLGYSEPELPG